MYVRMEQSGTAETIFIKFDIVFAIVVKTGQE
jgi:hypothetical protein